MGVSLNAGCCAASVTAAQRSPSLPPCLAAFLWTTTTPRREPHPTKEPHFGHLVLPPSGGHGATTGHRTLPARALAALLAGGRGCRHRAMVWENRGQVETGTRVIKKAATRWPHSSHAGGSGSGMSDQTFSCWWGPHCTGAEAVIFLITDVLTLKDLFPKIMSCTHT